MRATTLQDIRAAQPKRAELPSLMPKETAAAIRKILRAAFPATRFSITTARGSMVSSVDIRWTDGPTTQRVDELVGGFEAGHFDGMTDSYEYDRSAYLLIEGKAYRPGTRYVHTHRDHSPRAVARALRAVLAYWAFDAETLRQGEALAAAIEQADSPEAERAAVNAFYGDGWRLYIQNAHGDTHWNLASLTNRALADRTTCTHTHPEA